MLEDFARIADDEIVRARELHRSTSLSKRFEPLLVISNALASQEVQPLYTVSNGWILRCSNDEFGERESVGTAASHQIIS